MAYIGLMNRTQIYLEASLQEALRERAAAEGRSVASLIREAVARFLKPSPRKKDTDPFLAISGKFSGGPGDAAERHDDYLYRRRRR